MQSSLTPTFKLDDLNAVEATFEPNFNELGLHNWKSGHGLPACPCMCCCCSAAVEMKADDSQ